MGPAACVALALVALCSRASNGLAVTGGAAPTLIAPVCSRHSGGAFPTLFLLGARKSGTTSLIKDMHSTMPLLMPTIPQSRKGVDPILMEKELHFFDHGAQVDEGPARLSSYYPSCAEVMAAHQVPAEATPAYFSATRGNHQGQDPWDRADRFYAAEATDADRDRLVFVVIVRDPIHRYVSNYDHFCVREKQHRKECKASVLETVEWSVKRTRKHCDTAQLEAAQRSCFADLDFLKAGVYWLGLAGWARRFPRSQIIVTTFDHYLRDPNSVLQAVGKAIGAVPKRLDQPSHVNEAAHHADSRWETPEMRNASRLLAEFYAPHDKRFFELLETLQSPDQVHRLTFVGSPGKYS